jgi:eukaryotic-like serine/threonine-protein kinase
LTSTEINFDDINASLHLEGIELAGGWKVEQRRESANGGFSVSYDVLHSSGRKGFLKVLDLVSVFGDLDALQLALNDYLAERDLVLMCGEQKMSRVVVALDHGTVELEGYLPALAKVHYIIFERAESDLNRTLSELEATDVAVRLDLLHDLAVGLRQLHAKTIAHQDIKPKNALVFEQDVTASARAKVADLGRAFQSTVATPHDNVLVPGDRSFAPPEQLYGLRRLVTDRDRFAADLYQFGSLICYAFGGVTMNGMLSQRLSSDHHWDTFGDGYIQALPYLQQAFGAALTSLKDLLPDSVQREVIPLIADLCEPDTSRRGHPHARQGSGSRLTLERVISDLNLAAHRNRVYTARA